MAIGCRLDSGASAPGAYRGRSVGRPQGCVLPVPGQEGNSPTPVKGGLKTDHRNSDTAAPSVCAPQTWSCGLPSTTARKKGEEGKRGRGRLCWRPGWSAVPYTTKDCGIHSQAATQHSHTSHTVGSPSRRRPLTPRGTTAVRSERAQAIGAPADCKASEGCQGTSRHCRRRAGPATLSELSSWRPPTFTAWSLRAGRCGPGCLWGLPSGPCAGSRSPGSGSAPAESQPVSEPGRWVW